jgi:hypothetical protein
MPGAATGSMQPGPINRFGRPLLEYGSYIGPSMERATAERTLPDKKTRRALIETIQASGALRATPGPGAARSQDLLYNDVSGDFSKTDVDDPSER